MYKNYLCGRSYLYSLIFTSGVVVTLLLPGQLRAQSENIATAQQLSSVFTAVAEQAVPAVVFINVEKAVDAQHGPFPFNNPLEEFGDEFVKRFFRWREQS